MSPVALTDNLAMNTASAVGVVVARRTGAGAAVVAAVGKIAGWVEASDLGGSVGSLGQDKLAVA